MLGLFDALDAGSLAPEFNILFPWRFGCWINESSTQYLMRLDSLDAAFVGRFRCWFDASFLQHPIRQTL